VYDTIYTLAPANFSFAQLITNAGSDYALIKNPLVVPASSGYGLDAWVVEYGNSRIINSAYRSPAHNAAVGGTQSSRHMLGDAVDLQNQTCANSNQPCTSAAGIEEWVRMVNAAGGQVSDINQNPVTLSNTGAKASFIEPKSGPCGLWCTHADWRYKDRNKYVH
jgi:hypothetical protein